MAFHDALVRDNHDYAIHDVGEKYYSNRMVKAPQKNHIRLVKLPNFIGLQVW